MKPSNLAQLRVNLSTLNAPFRAWYCSYNSILLVYKARRCEFLFPPANGIIVGQCLTEYSSVCRMQCYEGYEAVGSVERKCDVSANNVMEWTGSPLQCVGKWVQ